jgi:hypothetical protein
VRAVQMAVALALALALQAVLARALGGIRFTVDLVLVAVVYVALSAGSAPGLIAGALGGLIQDTLAATGNVLIVGGSGAVAATSVVGVGGLAKTVVGFFTGIVGTQFIVARPTSRFVVFFGASLVHGAMYYGLYTILDARYGGVPYRGVVNQSAVNAVIGVLVFQALGFMPAFLERRWSGRGRMKVNRPR